MEKILVFITSLLLAVSTQAVAPAYDNAFNAGVGMMLFYDAECSAMSPEKMKMFEEHSEEENLPATKWLSDSDVQLGYDTARSIGCSTLWQIMESRGGPTITQFFE
jgi:hypothetical protein